MPISVDRVACQAYGDATLVQGNHEDYQEFAQKVHAPPFEVPKAHNWAKRVDNDHTPLWHTLQLESSNSYCQVM